MPADPPRIARTAAEIDHALRHCVGALQGAFAAEDRHAFECLAAQAMALKWVLGDENSGGFSGMLTDWDAIDREEAANARN